jgi:uncharacterized membrane protein SpoIIM required for sporulation
MGGHQVNARRGLFGLRASLAAIGRARIAILTVAATYVISVAAGMAMVGTGNAFALERRDEVVSAAQSSEINLADRGGDRIRAALLDFAANLMLGGVTSTVFGLAVVGSYPIVAYRGWIGGIVSVDAHHESRLADPGRATYYLVTLVLQLIPYSIAGGMGVYVGVDAWRALRRPRSDRWLGFSKDRLRDVALAYVVVIPLFLIASLWEFLVR